MHSMKGTYSLCFGQKGVGVTKIDLQFWDLKTHVGRSNCLFNLEGIFVLYNMHLLIVNSYFQPLLVCDATSVVINERK